MAKISSYPSDANVTTSDRLIGSDNENSNEAKNFEIGDIINLAASIILPQVGTAYVPYTGATADVLLGANDIYANAGLFSTVFATNINPNAGNPLIFIGGGGANGGVKIDTSANTYKFGDFDGNVNGTSIQIFDSQQHIQFIGGFYLNGNEGTAGQVLVSNGAGQTPVWSSAPVITQPYLYAIDTTTQTVAANGIAPMQYNTVQGSNGISIGVDDTYGTPNYIIFDKAGIYNIQFSAQLQRTSGGSTKQVSIWLRYLELDVPNSNTHLNLQANAGYLVAAWNFFVEVQNDGDGVQIMWSQDDTINIQYDAANLVVPHPATPSVILTVNKVSN